MATTKLPRVTHLELTSRDEVDVIAVALASVMAAFTGSRESATEGLAKLHKQYRTDPELCIKMLRKLATIQELYIHDDANEPS